MTAKQYLMQSVLIREKMTYISERIDKLHADLGYHPQQLDNSGASHLNYREDQMLKFAAELDELEHEWEVKRVELEKKNNEIREFIETLDNPEYVAVLTQRYITENKRYPARLNTWVAIAFKLGLTSEEAVKQKHKRALLKLEKNFNK